MFDHGAADGGADARVHPAGRDAMDDALPGGGHEDAELTSFDGRRVTAERRRTADLSELEPEDVRHHTAVHTGMQTATAGRRGLSEFGDGAMFDERENPTQPIAISAESDEAVAVARWRAGIPAAEGPVGFAVPPTAADSGGHTRVESDPAGHRQAPTDAREARVLVDQAIQLVRAARNQASRLDLEKAPGMTAQLSAALHRLNEALAKLPE